MFDIGFSELLVIGVIALLVIGPERLPKVARVVGAWLGRLNRYVAEVKQDIDRDMKLDELRKLQAEMRETAQKYEILAAEAEQKAEGEVRQVDRLMQAMATTEGSTKRPDAAQPEATESLVPPDPASGPAATAPPASPSVTVAAAPGEADGQRVPAPDSKAA